MKNFKKVTAAVAATLMAATMVAPMAMNLSASAVTELTLTNPVTSPASTIANVKAFKIFNMSKNNGAQIIDGWGITDGEGSITNIDAFLNAIKVAELGLADNTTITPDAAGAKAFGGILTQWQEAATAVVPPITDTSTEDDKAAAAAAQANVDAAKAKINAFAKIAANTLKTDGIDGTWTKTEATGETPASEKVTFGTGDEVLANGYYVMVCDVIGPDNDGNAENENKDKSKSLGMLTVIDGNAEIVGVNGEAKVGLPEVMKKVKEDTKRQNKEDKATIAGKADSEIEWNDAADYDIGDAVPFKLYGTLPSNLDEYDTYFYKFTDTLSSNFNMPTELTITVDNENTENDLIYSAQYNEGNWKLYIDGPFGSLVNYSDIDVAYTETNGFTVTFNDIKGNQKADKSTLVTIEYTAVLNENAVVGKSGQDNAVKLEYSNNPNNSGEGNSDKGETPDDKVRVYTYGFEIEKQFFAAGSNSPVTDEEVTNEVFEKVDFNIQKGDAVLKFKKLTGDADGYDYVLVDSNTDVNDGTDGNAVVTTDLKLTRSGEPGSYKYTIKVKGLDDGSYTLIEKTAPDGYTKAEDKVFNIKADTENNQTWDKTDDNQPLKNFDENGNGSFEENEYSDAIAQELVENRKGNSLPSTGGIGTTLFYLGGGAMVAVAGIFLITKKRMNKDEA